MAGDLGPRLDSIVAVAISQGAAPGVSLAVGRYGRLVHMRAYGRIDTGTVAPIVTDSTLFDMASLTKVVATTTAAMILEDEGKLDLDAPLEAATAIILALAAGEVDEDLLARWIADHVKPLEAPGVAP